MKTKIQISKQVLSIILCIVMLFSLTMPAMAAEDGTHTLYININQVVDSTKEVSGVYLWIYNETESILANEPMNHEYGAVYSYSVPNSYKDGCIRFFYADDQGSLLYYFDATGNDLYTPSGEYEGTWEIYSECSHKSYTDGKCDDCGEECRHESVADESCNVCGAEGMVVHITMNDNYGDGWSGNAIKIEQIVDGVYTEVGTATLESDWSDSFRVILPEDGIYVFSWVKGEWAYECRFSVTVNGEKICETIDGSEFADGQVLYTNCVHTGGTQTCGGYQCEICGMFYGEGTNEHISEDGDAFCDLCDTRIIREIKPGDTYTVTTEERVKFVPAVSGTFIIRSVSDVDPRVTLYDADFAYLADEDDSGYREENDLDFYLEYEFTAGETYYFEFYDYREEYNYTVTIIEPCSVHTGGTQTCKGFKCEVCENWYGETGEHTAEGEQTCLGTFCSVCGEYFGEASEHDLSSEQTCLGYYCYSCGEYFGEADPDAHDWNDTYCDICGDEHDHTGGTQTCKGFKCEVCENWYGEAGEQHDLSTEQTCKGYRCNWCYGYFGETGEHSSSTEQTCIGYMCEYCYEWFGEADTSKHSWFYGYCDYCDAEYPVDEECVHDLDNGGECITCGYQCPHEIIEDGTCTSCSYALPFSLTTGENVTYHGSFPDAFDKAEDGSVIKLLKDYDDYNSVEINKEITLDLNGKEWIQPSSGGLDVTANATFTDSVGTGYLDYSLYLYSPVTFSGGAYRYIEINFETEDTIGDYLADCYACFDHYTDELIDVTDKEYVLGVTIKLSHNLGDQTCKGYKCEDCGEYFGEADPDAHDWSNLDGVCANGCGLECAHDSYTDGVCDTCGTECQHENYTECVCDTCGYECPHEKYTMGICDECNYLCSHSFTVFNETVAPKCEETGWEESYCDYCSIKLEQEIPALDHSWVSGGVERPAQNIDGSWSDGYYYDTCRNDVSHINKTGVAKRADYSAYDEAYKALKTEQKNANLTDAGAASVNQAVMTGMMMPQNIIEDENTAAYLNNWVKNAQSILAKIESGEYVKADYTEIDEAVKAVDEALENAKISEEMAAELADIKADLETLKENADATMADVNALLDRTEAITETMDNCANGVHSFTKYEEVTAPECGIAGLETASCDNGCGATDENEIPALTHVDNNGDYLCDHGCGHEFEKPVDPTPDTPDEPTDGDCDHLCHKTGIMSIFWKIISFFQRLFNIQQYCDCGALHYEKAILG